MDFSNWKKQIDDNLDLVFDREINVAINNDIRIILEELKRLSKGGKRVRGILIKIGQLLDGKDDDTYLPLATAFEIFQTAVLIHDDIIDEAEERRGLPTITNKYPGHNGLSRAICAGDLGFFLSYKLINQTDFSNDIKYQLLECYTNTLLNTAVGEIIDVELPLKDFDYHLKMDDKIIYDIYVNKTSWYTFVGPLLLGAISAGINKTQLKSIIDIGINLGIAFQIKDDLLGLYSTKNEMGKTLNDIKENKQTIIYKYAIDHASDSELRVINDLYGKELDENDTKRLLNLFIDIGAKANAENLVLDYTNRAIKLIEDSEFANKEYLTYLANSLVNRNK